MERRRTPDSELLPEDSDHRGPAAELPRVERPEYEPLFDDLVPRRKEAQQVRSAATPVGDKPPISETRKTEPARTSSAIEEPATGGTFMGFVLGRNDTKPEAKAEGDSGYAVSGPSFLGLSEPAAGNPEYLLEDDRPRHSAGKWFLAIVVLIGVLAYGQWRANGRGQTLFAGLPAIRAPKPVTQTPKPTTSADDDDSAPDMDVAPTNADLKAQTEAAKKADANTPSADTTSTSAANSAPATNSTKAASDSKTAAPVQDSASKKADAKSASDKDTKAESDEEADAAKDDAEPTPAKATVKQPPVRLEKTKAAKPKPPKGADPSVALLAQGQRYLYGQGVRKSCEQALNLIHNAANQGNAEARSQLGGMYATGNCAPFDRVMAYRWFSLALAASPRNPTVQRTRDMLWREMTDNERAHARSAAE